MAESRIASGESHVAEGAALNQVMGTPRLSADVDLFHDTASALEASWRGDRELLERHDFSVRVVRERPSFVEAEVSSGGRAVLLQWVRDSAYRFFPLVEHAEFGLTLHPIDLATNKVLALVGRLEVRDWVDVLECDARLQPLGYLAWAACSKDPGSARFRCTFASMSSNLQHLLGAAYGDIFTCDRTVAHARVTFANGVG
jgi:hypothetical protein